MSRSTGVVALRERVHGWTLRRRVAVVFGLLAAVLAGLTLAIVVALVVFIDRGDAIASRWGPASLRSQALLTDMINEETGVRGYALTGSLGSLQPYQQASAQEPIDIASLRAYLNGHPRLLQLEDAFEAAASTWVAQTAQPLIALVQNGDPQAQVRLSSLPDKARFDAVRARGAALSSAVATELSSTLAARRDAAAWLIVALIAAAALLSAGAFAVWRAMHGWVLAPVDALAHQVRRVSAGAPNARISPRGPPELLSLGHDVEQMRLAAQDALREVEAASTELARSNADLTQFAYVASHDLSEPLRKVANFCQLLERQYGAQLDDTARQYIDYAVDGAKRMQQLIADLLALSRVGRSTESFQEVDLAAVLQQALGTLEDDVEATGTGVGYTELPTIVGDRALLVALFENLLGNAIKYRGSEPPLITVTAVRDHEPAGAGTWTFGVADNGIGIDPRYAERIFAIFQRLHLREDYTGTGIGLALCRRIVEFHGGRIWLDTQAGQSGATFRFTLTERPPGEH